MRSQVDDWLDSSSPFLKEPLMGYERWESNDSGVWYPMVQPRSKGYGIHVAQLLAVNHHSFYSAVNEVSLEVKPDVPYLYPVIVQWESLIEINNKGKRAPTEHAASFMMDYPCVAITRFDSPASDERYAQDNIHLEFDSDRHPYGDLIQISPEIVCHGFVPMWTVIPISEKIAKHLIHSVRALESQDSMGMLQFDCICELEGYHEEDCAYENDYHKDCDCYFTENIMATVERLYDKPPNPQKRMDNLGLELWDMALDSFHKGWEVIHNTEGPEWVSYSRLYQSPFLDSPGLSAKELKEWQDSTTSQMQQEYSRVS